MNNISKTTTTTTTTTKQQHQQIWIPALSDKTTTTKAKMNNATVPGLIHISLLPYLVLPWKQRLLFPEINIFLIFEKKYTPSFSVATRQSLISWSQLLLLLLLQVLYYYFHYDSFIVTITAVIFLYLLLHDCYSFLIFMFYCEVLLQHFFYDRIINTLLYTLIALRTTLMVVACNCTVLNSSFGYFYAYLSDKSALVYSIRH